MRLSRVHPFAWLAALLALTAALFAPVLGYDFINLDDPYLVQNNADLQRALDAETLLKPVAGLYHPLTNLTFWIDAHLFGMTAGGFHASGLFFHLLATLGIFLWIWRLTDRSVPALALAAAFAWHPTHVESVAWISERKDVVSVAFYFLALAAHAESLREGSRRWRVACLALMALSLLGKPFAMSLPVALLLIEWWKRDLRLRARLAFWLSAFAMSLAAGLLVLKSQGEVRARAALDLGEAAVKLPQQLLFYLWKTWWPSDLKLLYGPDDLLPALAPATVAAAVGVATLWCAWRSPRFRRDLLFGLGFFLIAVAPMLKLVPFGDNTPVADRYLYVAQTGLLWPWAMALGGSAWTAVAAGAVLLAWAGLACVRLPDWRDPPAIWESMLRLDPDAREAHENLGRYYLGKEQPALALRHLEKGMTMVWDNAHNQAFVLMRLGRLEEASERLARVEKLVPNDPKVLNLRGNLFMEMGQVDEAEAYFRRSLAAPALLLGDLVKAEAQTNLGVVAFRRGRFEECVRWQDESLRSLPTYVYAFHNRGVCEYQLRRFDEARRDYEMTVRLEPGFAMAHNGLGAIALQRGKFAEAEAHFRDALRADPKLPVARENLNRTLRLTGRPPEY